MMSSGGKPTLLGQQLVGALADRDLALDGVGLALLVEGHDDDGGAVAQHLLGVLEERAPRLPSCEIELTIALPCTHFRPASMTLHFELSIITGTREMSGSDGDEVEERRHRLLGVEQALVHVDVDDLRAGSRPAGARPTSAAE